MTAVWLLVTSIAMAQDPAPAAVSAQQAMRAAMEKQQAAAARQRESIRKQAENAGVWLMPGGGISGDTAPVAVSAAVPSVAPEPVAQMPCDPIADIAMTPMIDAAAKGQSLDTKLLRAVIEQESSYRPCAVSPKGAKGLMQLMPDTAEEMGVKDALDPVENIQGGAKYLRQLLDKYKGDVSQALGAYNAGPATVDQAGGVPNIRETRDYVKAILQKLAPTRTDPPSIPPPKPIEN